MDDWPLYQEVLRHLGLFENLEIIGEIDEKLDTTSGKNRIVILSKRIITVAAQERKNYCIDSFFESLVPPGLKPKESLSHEIVAFGIDSTLECNIWKHCFEEAICTRQEVVVQNEVIVVSGLWKGLGLTCDFLEKPKETEKKTIAREGFFLELVIELFDDLQVAKGIVEYADLIFKKRAKRGARPFTSIRDRIIDAIG